MKITSEQLIKIVNGVGTKANITSITVALSRYGVQAGLDKPHRAAHFIAQVAHESGGFKFDHEIWGPTPAQAKYDTRVDLGNTPQKDGDGKLYAGRGPIQVTGKSNYTRFHQWAVDEGYIPPDFVTNPDAILTDPWEGLSAIWYWAVGNPTGKSLNVYADENNIEQITKKINGGLNGFDDRVNYYVRAALVLLRYPPDDVIEFQKHAFPKQPDQWDGDAGPKTRAELHKALVSYGGEAAAEVETKAAPVTQPVAVAPKIATRRTGIWSWGLGALTAGGGQIFSVFTDWPWQVKFALILITLGGVVFLLLRGEFVVRRIKELADEINK